MMPAIEKNSKILTFSDIFSVILNDLESYQENENISGNHKKICLES